MVTVSRVAVSVVFAVFGVPGFCVGSEEGVAQFFYLTAAAESGGNCAAISGSSSAMGCYQMTDGALQDAGFKDETGAWVPNEFGITSDAEFLENPEANYAAMAAYTAANWRALTCDAKGLICDVMPGNFRLDAAALLAGAHILGATGVSRFLDCSMRSSCLSDRAVRANGVGREGLRDIVVRRMELVAAENLDISELIQSDPRGCGVLASCR